LTGSVKLRLGHPTLEQDLAVTRAVRKRLPGSTELPVDYNQALTVAEAIRRGHTLESEGIAWLEEPIRIGRSQGARAGPMIADQSRIRVKSDEWGRLSKPWCQFPNGY
jgi:L-alanine-DL-glutamate epimerase-like enolase superfamily enzyme